MTDFKMDNKIKHARMAAMARGTVIGRLWRTGYLCHGPACSFDLKIIPLIK
jgi:hypothetical protein